MRYFYGHTLLAGSPFEYHGEPIKILKGRLIAVALIAPYYIFQKSHPLVSAAFILLFLIALPFIVVQSRRFQMRVSSWRNVHFGFDGRFGAAAGIYLGFGALIPLTLGLIMPYVQFAKQRFLIGESRFGATKFTCTPKPGRFYAAYFAALGWWILAIACLIALFVAGAFLVGLVTGAASGMHLSNPRQLLGSAMGAAAFLVLYLGFLATFMVPGAVLTSRIANETLNHTRLGDNQLHSSVSGRKLLGIYLGNFALIVLTLGFYAPWAKIRLLRYRLQSIAVIASGNLEEFVQMAGSLPSAAGEELGDFLDVDFGF